MKPSEVEMPSRMKKLPTFHGYPITFVTFVGEDGLPDFKVVDEKKRRSCLQRNLCGLCGEELGSVIVFIGGPSCIEHHLFLDPPMHPECGLYAAKVCPYLSDSQHDYSSADPKHLREDQTVIIKYEQVNPHRPDRLGIYYCHHYEMVRYKGNWYAKAGKPFKVDWTTMPQRERHGHHPGDQRLGTNVAGGCTNAAGAGSDAQHDCCQNPTADGPVGTDRDAS